MAKTGSPLAWLDADDFERYWRSDITTMAEEVKRIGRVE